jgi:hypothetical protein
MTTTTTTYLARWDGEIVGTRKSPRPYTHAVICQWDREAAKRDLDAWQPSKTDRSNWDYYVKIAAGNDPHPEYRTAADLAKIRATVGAGWEANVERLRDDAVRRFGLNDAKPYVAGWSMSAGNAAKMAADKARYRHQIVLGIVPAEVK